MVSIILAKSICCWQHFSLWNGLGPWGENFGFGFFFFFLLFLASKNYGSRASKRAKGRLIIFFPLSFFSFKYLLHTRGKKKKLKWLSELRVNGEQKKKGGGKAGGVAVRARTASNAELKREGGEGQREAALDRNPSSGGFRKGTFQQPQRRR